MGVFRVVVAAALSLAASAAFAAQGAMGAYVARGVDLTQYQTFDWSGGQRTTLDQAPEAHAALREDIRRTIARQLTARGLERSKTAPDVLVQYYAIVEEVAQWDRNLSSSDEAGRGEEPSARALDAITLTIEMRDARTRALVWRGWSERFLVSEGDDPPAIEKRITSAVRRILGGLP